MTSDGIGEIEHLKDKVNKLSRDKSQLQLIANMMSKIGASQGLDAIIRTMLSDIMGVIGGMNSVIFYYHIDDDLFCADALGQQKKIDRMDDNLVKSAFERRQSMEADGEFVDTALMAPEFAKAYAWAVPLIAGDDLVGVIKLEGQYVGMNDLRESLSVFFSFVAGILRNEMLGHSNLKKANDQLNEMNAEISNSNLALMNIVEDLNGKTYALKRANKKLMELDRLKSTFIAAMSHELRTPLNSVIGYSSILGEGWLGPMNPEQKENLSIINRSGKLLLNLINNVIDVSEIEAGSIEAHFESFDLRELLEEAASCVENDIRKKGLLLRLAIQHRIVISDRRRLLQCVINLLVNAEKFTERGEIALLASSAEIPLHVAISVSDTGIGIAQSEISRLFKPFVRLDSRLKVKTPGAGLGLYLTNKLVSEILGGDIQCSSILGKGSVFTLRIPEKPDEKSLGD
ncbi:MAG TPA: hypothetical protein DIC34_05145 [Treponema sp.]|nr:MAG: hypothetical protein A2001_14785 [Treponema sp. GWC1_61_84]OHE68874.1 MAG: hypothetical protein A2413_07625 [Treponema sp. RIFOXYC1_FULL_61_9]HCM25924.1 hypothetical protein [Treponema sp.]